MTRRQLIAHRARYLAGDFLGRDEASLTREPSAEDFAEQRKVGERAGGLWVARHRGLVGI